MDKRKIIKAMIEQLENDLMSLKEAARATYEAATHEESKPENEYDTRGLEAAYLAGAQAKRAAKIDEILSLFRHVEIKTFNAKDAISSTALVELKLKSKNILALLMPLGGGVSLSYEGRTIQIVTPASVLGESLLGLHAGDIAEVEVGDKVQEYQILSVS
ncbi:MAG: hypothetical protein COT73_08135 [Bdellovibrio sp. CG10_big_fil_rev_8_21_14_0_10_47_8]|nr:MAG: hypothetical protein COT73_08135 [Bdellovibrio sp. CG10_big_fil_rev_8_21_14_0_10_47_8]